MIDNITKDKDVDRCTDGTQRGWTQEGPQSVLGSLLDELTKMNVNMGQDARKSLLGALKAITGPHPLAQIPQTLANE